MKLTKEEMEQYEAKLAKAKAEMSPNELAEYERSSRRWTAICDARENGTIAEILEDISEYQQGLHDVPGMSRFQGLRGLRVSGEVVEAIMRISKKIKRDLHACPHCWQEESKCGCEWAEVPR
jgi:hypothetical protein